MATALRRDDEGSITPLVLLLFLPLLFVAGLVIDGGRAITNRERAADTAQQAARAGANVLDQSEDRGHGHDYVDPAGAQQAACGWVTTANPSDVCVATVGLNEVTVKVTTTSSTILLAIAGYNTFTDTATATARTAHGYTTEVP